VSHSPDDAFSMHFQTSVFLNEIAQIYVLEDCRFDTHRHENLKSDVRVVFDSKVRQELFVFYNEEYFSGPSAYYFNFTCEDSKLSISYSNDYFWMTFYGNKK
jgi:hypothetical protein